MKSDLVKMVDGKKTLFGVEIKRNDINQTCLWKIFNNVISDEEMKETETNLIHKEILRNSLAACFWEVMNARSYFIDELLFTDFMDYTIDLAGDSNDLSFAIVSTG